MRDNAKRLQDLMRERSLDALIISAPENVFYVSDVPTSFTAANRLLFCSRRTSPVTCILPAEGEPCLVLSAAAHDVTVRHTWIKDLRFYATGTYVWRRKPLQLAGTNFLQVLARTLTERLPTGKPCKVGVEMNDLSAQTYMALKGAHPELEIVDGTEPIMLCRMIKNSEEVRRFIGANNILCKAIRKVEDACEERPTEEELVRVLKSTIMKEGAESWQQTTIAAGRVSGPDIYNQPVPRRRIRRGDLIRLDVGCVYKGYTADLSRTFAVDRIPERAAKTYRVLKEAYMKFLDEITPGTAASKINIGVVDLVRKNLDSQYYRGNVGHGVGVELYDKPLLSADDDTPLQAGMTLSYEVPYHISGLGGLNLEDSVLIGKRGKQVVSKYDRDIIIV